MGSFIWLFQMLSFLLFLLHFQAISSLLVSSTQFLCHHDESLALILFKNSFSIDEGADDYEDDYPKTESAYPKTESWKEDTDCCLRWDGVICEMETGHVIGLNLSRSLLSGNFPPNSSLFFLSHLQYLDLSYNDFNSSHISSEFGQFPKLTYLNLQSSSFVGQVPLQISLLSRLVSLDLSQNYGLSLQTTTFSKLVHNLTKLTELQLSGINMSSVAPDSFMNLPSSLSHLDLSNCGLRQKLLEHIGLPINLASLDISGNFDLSQEDTPFLSLETTTFSMLLGNLTMLRELDLTWVNMSLVAPHSLLNLSSSLSSLSLCFCKLRGELPGAILQLPNLQYLDLGGNEDITSISPPMSNRSSSLRHLDISSTGFLIYSLLDFFSNLMDSLEILYLSRCNYVGSNVALLGNLTQLSDLRLCEGNNLNGIEIPSSFGNLVKLSTLDISSCNFSGQIPSTLGNLKQLLGLDLSDNNLGGSIPNSLANLTRLSGLDLSNNQLVGPIPFQLGNLNQLYTLRLDDNHLSGSIPNFFANLTQLFELNLSKNQLVGPIPFQLSNVLEVDLSNNFLNGTIPLVLFSLPKLQILKLNNNQLNGEFGQFQHNSSLSYINLSNKLHGPIPSSINKLVALQVLLLSSNDKLIGEVPSSTCKLQSLQILDLSNNSLSGYIPKCLGNFSNHLEVLHLGMNSFSGTIPPFFSNASNLRYMNLNDNQLDGKIPLSINNCKSLEVLDLGNNEMLDTFPYFLEALQKLQVLVLRSNKLHGLVENLKFKSLFSKLRIFDLSNNNLRGTLPTEYFDQFEAMMTSENNMEYMNILWC